MLRDIFLSGAATPPTRRDFQSKVASPGYCRHHPFEALAGLCAPTPHDDKVVGGINKNVVTAATQCPVRIPLESQAIDLVLNSATTRNRSPDHAHSVSS